MKSLFAVLLAGATLLAPCRLFAQRPAAETSGPIVGWKVTGTASAKALSGPPKPAGAPVPEPWKFENYYLNDGVVVVMSTSQVREAIRINMDNTTRYAAKGGTRGPDGFANYAMNFGDHLWSDSLAVLPYYPLWEVVHSNPPAIGEVTESRTAKGQEITRQIPSDLKATSGTGEALKLTTMGFENGKWVTGSRDEFRPRGFDGIANDETDQMAEWALSGHAAPAPHLPRKVVLTGYWKGKPVAELTTEVATVEPFDADTNADELFAKLSKGMVEIPPGFGFEPATQSILGPGGSFDPVTSGGLLSVEGVRSHFRQIAIGAAVLLFGVAWMQSRRMRARPVAR